MSLHEWIQSALSSLQRRVASNGSENPRLDLIPELSVMRLEPRRVLNGDGVASELVVDAGTSADDGHADTVEIFFDQDSVEVSINGDAAVRRSLSGIDRLVLQGSSDDDVFRIQSTHEKPNTVELIIDGRGGNDSLVLSQIDRVERLIHLLDDPTNGRVVIDSGGQNSLVEYQGIETVTHDVLVDRLDVRLAAAIDAITLDGLSTDAPDDISSIDQANELRLVSGGQQSSIRFGSPSQSFQLDVSDSPSSGADVVRVEGLADTFQADLILIGDADDLISFSGVVDVDAGNVSVTAGQIEISGTIIGDASEFALHGQTSLQVGVDGRVSNTHGSVVLDAVSVDIVGEISARQVLVDSGPHGVTRLFGWIDVSDHSVGATGGVVHLLGDHVGLFAGAAIDASGSALGGSVLVGGDYQGANTSIVNARRTYLGAGATINAGAVDAGDGGRVIVWADEVTRFFGAIQARGGSLSGNGGFVEVSGREFLEFSGDVDLTAGNGDRGTLLLDPRDIEIVETGSDVLADADAFGDPKNAVSLSASDLVAALDGADVELRAHDEILVSFAIDASENTGNGALTLRAGRSIDVQQNITLKGAFTAMVNDPGEATVDEVDGTKRTNGAALFTMSDGVTIDTSANDDNITIEMLNGFNDGSDFSGNLVIESLDAGAGNVTVANRGAQDGSSILTESTATNASSIVGNVITLIVTDSTNNPTGAVGDAAAPMLVTATSLLAQGQNGGVFVQDTGGLVLSNIDSGTGGVEITSDGALSVVDLDATGNVTLSTSSGNLSLADDAIQAGTGDVQLTASSGQIVEAVATANAKITTSGTVQFNASGGIGSSAADAAVDTVAGTIDATSSGGEIHLAESDAVTISGLSTQGGAIAFASASGTVNVTGQVVAWDGVSTSGLVVLNAADLSISDSVRGSGVSIAATGTLSFAAGVEVIADGNATSVQINSGSVTLAAGTDGGEAIRHIGSGDVSLTALTGAIGLKDFGFAAANGDVTLVASAGAISETDVTTSTKISASGTVTLSAVGGIGSTAADEAIDLDAAALSASNSTSGSIVIHETDALTVGAGDGVNGITTATGGDVELIVGGLLSVTGGHQISAGGDLSDLRLEAAGIVIGSGNDALTPTLTNSGTGTIELVSTADITLGSHAIGNGTGGVTLGAGTADINVSDASSVVEVATSGTLSLIAASIGATNALDVENVVGLSIQDTGAGSIQIAERSSNTILDLSLIVGDVGYGSISVDYNNADSVTIGDNHTITSVNHQGADRGFQYQAVLGNLSIGQINTGNADTVLISSDGTIAEITNDAATKIFADTLTLTAAAGIGVAGGSQALDVSANFLAANVSTSGGIFLTEADGVQVTTGANAVSGLATAGDADLSLLVAGDLQISENVTAGAGNIHLSGANVTVAADVAGGNIDGDASATFSVGAGHQILAGGNSTTLTIDAASITLGDGTVSGGTVRNTGDGSVSLTATAGDITLHDQSIVAGTGTVTLAAGTHDVVMTGTSSVASITASGAVAVTAASVGDSANPLELNGATSLTLHDTGAGDINVAELSTASILLTDITVDAIGMGAIEIAYSNADVLSIADGHDIQSVNHAVSNRQFRYTAVSGTVQIADAAINTGNADVSITAAAGAITESVASTLVKITTSGGLMLSAATGIAAGPNAAALETQVGTFAGRTTSSGGIYISNSQSLAVGTVDGVTGVTTAGGAIWMDTGAGNLTVNQIMNSGIGNLDLAGADILVNADIAGNDVTIAAAGVFQLAPANAVTAGGNGTLLSISAASLSLQDGTLGSETLRNNGTGRVHLFATAGDITLGNHAVASDSGQIELHASGAIDESTDSDAINISTSGTLLLNAAGSIGATGGVGIGGTGPLDLAVSGLTAHSTGVGGIYLKNSGAITLTDVDSSSGSIEIAAGAAINVVDVDAIGGSVALVAASGDVTLMANAISSSGDASVVAAAGAISEPSNDGTTKVTATGTVTLSSATGIGSGGSSEAIEIIASGLAADSSVSGNIAVAYQNDLQIGSGYDGVDGVNSAGAFTLTRLSGTGQLLITQAISAGGDVSLDAIDANANASISGNNVTINLTGGITVAAGSRVIGGGDGTAVTLVGSSVVLGAGSTSNETVSNSGTGTITLQATGGGIVLPDHAVRGGTGLVTLQAAGSIQEASANNTRNVTTGGQLTLTAQSGIGVSGGAGIAGTGPLDLDAVTLVATSSGAGGIYVKDAGGVTLSNITTSAGDVEVRSTGALSITNVDAIGAVTLVATSGNITLADAAIDAGSGNVSVTASGGAILETSVGTTTKIRTNGTLALSANAGIGGAATDAAIDIDAPLLAAESTGAGGVFIVSQTNLLIGTSASGLAGMTSAGGGAIAVTAGSNSLVIDQDISGGGGDVTLSAVNVQVNANLSGANIDIDATAAFEVTAAHRIIGGGNGTTIEIAAASISLQPGALNAETIRNTGSGGILISAATGDVRLTDHALRSDTGTIAVSAVAGAIFEDVVNSTRNIATSGGLSLIAASGIGSAVINGAIDTQVGMLAARVTGTGGIFIREIDGIQIDTVASTVGLSVVSGDIQVASGGGNLIVNQAVQTLSGNIDFSGGNFTVNSNVQGDDVTVVATGSVSLSGGSQFVAGGNGTTLSITAASMALGAGTSGNEVLRNAGSGNVSLTITTGDLQLFEYAIASVSGNITVAATSGAIENPSATALPQITTTGIITLSAATGIGNAGNAIMTDAGTLAARTVTSGGIYLGESNGVVIAAGDLGISGLTTSGGGDVQFVSASGLTRVDSAILAGAGSITISTATLDLNANVQGAGIDIDASGTVDVASGVQIIGGGNGTAVTLDGSAVAIGLGATAAETIRNSGTGTVTVTAVSGDVSLTDGAIGVGVGRAEIRADGGAVLVNNATPAAEINAFGDVAVTAAAVATAANPLRINGATRLLIGDTGAGDSFFAEINANTIAATEITVGNNGFGAIAVDYFDSDAIAIGNNHLITTVAHQSGNRNFSYQANAGDIRIQDSAIITGTASVTLRADTGSIIESNTGTPTNIQSGGVLTLIAAGNIGSGVANAAIDVDVATVAASSSAGDIYLHSPSAITIGTGNLGVSGVTATGGDVSILATGNVNVLSGVRVRGGGVSTAVTLEGATVTVGSGGSGSETVTNTGTGTVTINSFSGNASLDNHAIGADLGTVTINVGSNQISVAQSNATAEIRAAGIVSLSAGSVGTSATNPLDIEGASTLSITDLGIGAMFLREVGGNSITFVSFSVLATSFGTIDIDFNNADLIDIDGANMINSVATAGFGRAFSYIATSGNISLGQIATGTADVSLLTFAGNINESVTDTSLDISTTGTVTLTATNGIGAGGVDQALDLDVGILAAQTTVGGVFIEETNGITIGSGSGGVNGISAGTGDIRLNAGTSDVTVNRSITASAGVVDLAGRSIDINDDVIGTSVNAIATGNVDIQSGSQMAAAAPGGSVVINAVSVGLGDGASGNETVKVTGAGTITVSAVSGDVSLGVHAIGGGSGDVTVSAGSQSIQVLSATGTVEIAAAGNLFLTAASIGSPTQTLEIQGVQSLTLNDTGVGNMSLSELAGSTITALEISVGGTGFGSIDIDYANTDTVSIGQDHLINQVAHTGADRSFMYTAASGEIQLGAGGIATAGAPVTLIASSGAIVEAVADLSTKITTPGTLTLSAATGIGDAAPQAAIGIQSGTLAAETTSSGGIYLAEQSDLVIGTGANAVVGVSTAGSGDVVVTAGDNASVQADIIGHNVDLNVAGVTTVVAGIQVIAGGNATALNLVSGGIDLAGGSLGNETLRNSGTGSIQLQANSGNIAVRNHSIASDSGSVSLDAQSFGIDVVNLLAAPHVSTSGTVSLTAATIGGVANPLDLFGTTAIVVQDTGAGAIYLREFAAATIASTSLTVADPASGDITVTYADSDQIKIDGGHQIRSVIHNQSNRAFSYEAVAGDVLLDPASIDTGTADVVVAASSGSILDAGGSSTPNVTTTGTVTLSASGSVGTGTVGGQIDLQTGTLAARSTVSGGVFVSDTGGMTIGIGANGVTGVSTVGTGDIQISSGSGPLSITSAVTAANGNVTLAAADPPGFGIDIDAVVSGMNVYIIASGTVDVTSGVQVVGGGDGTTVEIQADSVQLQAGSAGSPTLENTGAGDVLIRSTGQAITLNPFSVGAGSGQITVDAGTQRIEVAAGTRTAEILTGGPVTLTASGIGSNLNQLEIDGATSLRINDTGGGDVFVSESGGITIASVTLSVAAFGHDAINVDFFGSDVITVDNNHVLTQIDLEEANRSLEYIAGFGDVSVGVVTTGSGAVNVTALGGSILDRDSTSATDISTTGTLTLSATGSIGKAGAGNALDTAVSSLAAQTTVAGSVFIHETDSIVIGTGAGAISGLRTSGGGTIQLTSDGGLLDVQQSVSAGAGNVSIAGDTLRVGADITGANVSVDANVSLDVLSGNRIIAGGDGTLLSISSPQLTLAGATAGAESLTNFGTGAVTVTATAGDVVLGDHAISAGTGGVSVTASLGDITEVANTSDAKISTPGNVSLIAAGAIGASGNGGATPGDRLDVSAGSLSAQSVGVGGVFVSDTDGIVILGVSTTLGDIEIQSDGQVFVQQAMTAGSGSVTIEANTIALDGSGDLTAMSGNILLSAVQLNGLSLKNDTVLATSQGTVSGQLLNAANPFSGSSNIGSSLSDTNRQATINVVLPDTIATNVGIEIDWKEGDVINPTPVVPPENLRARVVSSDIAVGTIGGTFSHLYEEPPDPSNPSADINIALRIVELAGGTIQLNTAGLSAIGLGKFSSQSLTIDVSSPILPFFISLPQVDAVEQLVLPTPVITPSVTLQRVVVFETPQEFTNSIGTAQESVSRYYVLRIVSFGDEGEVRLVQEGQEYRLKNMEDPDSESGFELSQLPELFERLPDDRYRIYMIDGQTERLVLDFIIRDGQPVEAQQDTGGGDAVLGDEVSGDAVPDDAVPDEAARPLSRADATDSPADLEGLPADVSATAAERASSSGDLAARLGSDRVLSSGGVVLSAAMFPAAVFPAAVTSKSKLNSKKTPTRFHPSNGTPE